MLYNCGRIFFFILSFFIGYVLSFGLVRFRTVRLSARAGDVTITNVIIKTPDRKWDWVWMTLCPGSDGLRILVIFEKSSELRSDAGQSELRFEAGWGESSWVYGMRCTFVGSVSWDFDSGLRVQLGSWLKNNVETVSIVKIVSLSLSLLVSKN